MRGEGTNLLLISPYPVTLQSPLNSERIMSYEQRFELDIMDFANRLDAIEAEDEFLYGPMIAGMRPLDYEPDMDDYEYQQSILY